MHSYWKASRVFAAGIFLSACSGGVPDLSGRILVTVPSVEGVNDKLFSIIPVTKGQAKVVLLMDGVSLPTLSHDRQWLLHETGKGGPPLLRNLRTGAVRTMDTINSSLVTWSPDNSRFIATGPSGEHVVTIDGRSSLVVGKQSAHYERTDLTFQGPIFAPVGPFVWLVRTAEFVGWLPDEPPAGR